MKKLFISFVALIAAMSANAFEFDGIDLNSNVLEVTRQISAKGYQYDAEKDCLKGLCQGTEIYLSINYADVKQKNKIGQLIVDVPMSEANALEVIAKTFNVVYHVLDKTTNTYQVSNDGTTVSIAKTKDGICLTYSTPYYKAQK